MGGSSYSSDTYNHIRATYVGKSINEVFHSRAIDPAMNPKGLLFRESRDSEANPEALPIIVGLDVTGSMGLIPHALCQGKLGTMIETMIRHQIKHPAVMFMGIGDHLCDDAPLQVGQFESGAVELNRWLTSVWLEGGGGGQNVESYLLAWLVAARHTVCDHFEKRKRKGYLFTIGDEWCHQELEAGFLSTCIGYQTQQAISREIILAEAQRNYEVFHIHINSTGYRNDDSVIGPWKRLLGERLLLLDDHENVAELIAGTVSIIEGARIDDVVAGFIEPVDSSVTRALATVVGSSMHSVKGTVSL